MPEKKLGSDTVTMETKRMKPQDKDDTDSHDSSDGASSSSPRDLSEGTGTSNGGVGGASRLNLRKEKKSAREKARRQRENALFDELATMCNVPTETRDKSSVLKAVIKRVEELRSRNPSAPKGLLSTSSSSSFSSNGTDLGNGRAYSPKKQHIDGPKPISSTTTVTTTAPPLPPPPSAFVVPSMTQQPAPNPTVDDLLLVASRGGGWPLPNFPNAGLFSSFPSLNPHGNFPLPSPSSFSFQHALNSPQGSTQLPLFPQISPLGMFSVPPPPNLTRTASGSSVPSVNSTDMLRADIRNGNYDARASSNPSYGMS